MKEKERERERERERKRDSKDKKEKQMARKILMPRPCEILPSQWFVRASV